MLKTLAILIALASPALAQVEPRVVPGSFPANPNPHIGGGIGPIVTGANVVNGNEVTGVVTLDLWRHFGYDNALLSTVDTSATIVYTIDGNPVSPRLKAPYQWAWNSASVAVGPHVAGVVIVDGAQPTTYAPLGLVLFVGAPAGDKIPSLGTSVIRQSLMTGMPEWFPWTTGYTMQHPTTVAPYPAPVPPPAYTRGLPDGGLSLPFTKEPFAGPNVSLEAAILNVRRTKTGHVFADYYFPEGTADSDGSVAKTLAEPMMDGPRGDNGLSPYSTCTADPLHRGWACIDLAGRMAGVNVDGSIETWAGRQTNRDVVPYSGNDLRVTEADRIAIGQVRTVGTFPDGPWKQPMDLSYDSRDPNIWYVADEGNHRVTRTDKAAKETKVCATGFQGPSSVTVKPDGTVLVADYDAGNIMSIAPDCGTVSTVATGFTQPFSIKFDGNGNLVIAELGAGNLKRLDLTTGATTMIAPNVCGAPWLWIDVDRKGIIGPANYTYMACDLGGSNADMFRISPGGVVDKAPFYAGHYPWVVSIMQAPGHEEARILTYGFGDSAPTVSRLSAPGDVDTSAMHYLVDDWEAVGNRLGEWWTVWGCVPEFPCMARPAQAALRGYSGGATLPNFTSYDNLALLTRDQIGAWIQGGLGGGTPRPEFIGTDLKIAIDAVQLYSSLYPNRLVPPFIPPPVDTVPPVISDVRVSLVDSTTARVTWTTDEPTLGYVRFGPLPSYHRWSDIEASFGTAHSATLQYLPDSATVHFAVVVEDQASNFAATVDKTFLTGVVPPPPVPTATLAASPTSILAGANSTLTWSSTNATGCTGTGFTAGSPSGAAMVKPVVTTAYGMACSGPGGTSPVANATVTVTQPPPLVFPAVGAHLKLTVPVGVYATPSETGKKLCTQSKGAAGTVVGSTLPWLQINYASSCDGWSIYQTMTGAP